MASTVQIWNLALARIGVSQRVQSPTEKSAEVDVCSLFYDDDVLYVLRAFPWPFAKRYAVLALIEEAPVRGWDFAYRYPANGLYIRRIVTARGVQDPTPVAFELGGDDGGKLVYTNEAEAEVEYTATVTDPTRFDPEFVSALAWRLAANIAPALSRVQNASIRAMEMFGKEILGAQARALNESHAGPEPESAFIRARE